MLSVAYWSGMSAWAIKW